VSGAPAVLCEGVSVDLDGRRVLEDVTFSVAEGEFAGLVGPNGAGKTTLLRALLGLVPLRAGRITVLGHPPRQAPRGAIGYVPQRQAVPSGFPASVADVVALGRLHARGRLRRAGADDRAAVQQALARVGIAGLAARPVGRISGGQQRRVMLAQALAAGARLLILDEPTIGLDLPAEQEFYALLRRLQAELSLSVVAVSHDLVALAGACDELVCINRRVHVHGHPETVIHSHAIQQAYGCAFDFLAGELAHHERHAAGVSAGPPGER
jgi:ABC-type Mn2+/Zn2+ transport system ATPase subunit